jgi:ABC-2 type transport system ATP-binding protein
MDGGDAIIASALCRSFAAGRGRRHRGVDAVRDVTFSVQRSERVAFIGPNGAGKSTSIKMLTGILHPSSGHASVLGLVPWSQRRALASRIGTLFGQRSLLWQELPSRATFRVLAAVYELDDAAATRRVGELGELLDAAELFDQPVRTLSLGQRMRCELAACLLHGPELLFLDEPTIGLDLVAKQRFRELLLRLNAEHGTTVFLTSHDVSDIEHVADRTIVVNDGRVIYDAAAAAMRRDLLATKRIELTVEHRTPLASLNALARAGVTITATAPTTIHIDVDTTAHSIGTVLNDVLGAVAVIDLSVVDPPLETVISAIYERRG